MSFNARSYFAGVATVIATVAIGFGGGIMMTDALVGSSEKAASVSKLAEPPSAPVLAAAPVPSPAPVQAPEPALVAAPQAVETDASGRPLQNVQAAPKRQEDAMARASDSDMRQALATERRKADRRKRAERRKREIRKFELDQVAERVREESSYAQPYRINPNPFGLE